MPSKKLIPQIPIIAITGSNGKTTTKEMLYSILSKKWKVFKSRSNMNTLSNMHGYLKEIDASDEVIILEWGAYGVGSIKQLCDTFQPSIGIITMIGHAHVGLYPDGIRGIAQEKSQLIKGMRSDGLLVLNADDPHSALLDTTEFNGKIVRVSLSNPQAEYYGQEVHYIENGMRFFVTLNNEKISCDIPIHGQHNVYNALYAIAVADQLQCSPSMIISGLKNYVRLLGRLTINRLPGGVAVIDDSYNASPESAKAAIDVLAALGTQYKLAIFGGMLELGTFCEEAHMQIGHYLAQKKIDHLYTYSNEAKWIGLSAVEHGLSPQRVQHAETPEELLQLLTKNIPYFFSVQATILIKGSRKFELNKISQIFKNFFIFYQRLNHPKDLTKV